MRSVRGTISSVVFVPTMPFRFPQRSIRRSPLHQRVRFDGIVRMACIESKESVASPIIGDLAAGINSQTAGIIALFLKPTLSLYSLLMIVRIVMTWYPEIDGNDFPWSIAYKATGAVTFVNCE